MRNVVRNNIAVVKAKIICIQETKCSQWPDRGMNLLGKGSNEKWVAQKSSGLSGGLVTCWDAEFFQCMGFAQAQDWIWIQFRTRKSNSWFNIINIYSPLSLTMKIILSSDLMYIMSAIQNELVCIVGDFNSIRDNRERTNCVYRRRDMKEFNAFIKDANLMDLGLGNDNYTWFGPQGKCSKLDRFLVNGVWLESGSWSVSSLCRISSDHKPIHLKCEQILWGPKPFRGFNWWLQEDSLLKKLDSFWNEKKATNSGMNIQDTLKSVKGIIKPWIHDSKNTLQRRMKCLKEKLDDFDRNNVWGSERDNIKKELLSCFEKHESMLRQKSRYK